MTKRKANCPVCGKPGAAAYRPFCSKNCADRDLGQWLEGGYRIPAAPDERESEPDEEPH